MKLWLTVGYLLFAQLQCVWHGGIRWSCWTSDQDIVTFATAQWAEKVLWCSSSVCHSVCVSVSTHPQLHATLVSAAKVMCCIQYSWIGSVLVHMPRGTTSLLKSHGQVNHKQASVLKQQNLISARRAVTSAAGKGQQRPSITSSSLTSAKDSRTMTEINTCLYLLLTL